MTTLSSVHSCSYRCNDNDAPPPAATAVSYRCTTIQTPPPSDRCSYRCNNSISILQRQKAAAKLETCTCDGSEAFDCSGIKRNMARLCFHQYDERQLEQEEELTNQVDTTAASKARLNSATGLRSDQNVLWLTTVAYVLISAVVRWNTSIR